MTTFVLAAKAEKGFKIVKMSLANFGRKEIQKKEKRASLLGRTASLSTRSAARPSTTSSPARGRAHLAPPGAGHVAAVRRRRGRGRPVDRHKPVGTPPRAPKRPTLSPPRSLSFSARERSSSNCRGAIAGRAPPLAAGHVSEPFSTPRPPPCSSSPR